MLTEKQLELYGEIAVKIGVNLQPGQELYINCPVERSDMAHLFAKAAYKYGAKYVTVKYYDEKLNRINYENATTERLCEVPNYFVEERMSVVEKNAAFIAITSQDPDAYLGIDAEKMSKRGKAYSTALREFMQAEMSNKFRWLVVPVPSKAWAKKVYPSAKDEYEAMDMMWDAIAKTVRLDTEDPVKAWEEHIGNLKRRSAFLNEHNFEYIHFTNGKGTNLMVGLAQKHMWTGAQEKASDGVMFTANMPTEEVFTAPHMFKVNGIVKNALPLVENGNVIDNFSMTFKDGEIVDFTAEQGYETLKGLLETDAGAKRLGEIALIGKNSPIAQSNTLFYNTLFDENASCHLAFGASYPTTILGGESMSREELAKLGANDSLTHVDFMIGTPDLSVVGIDYNGNKVTIFEDGEWVI